MRDKRERGKVTQSSVYVCVFFEGERETNRQKNRESVFVIVCVRV